LIAALAAQEALAKAGIETRQLDPRDNTYKLESIDPERVGIYFGTGIGGATSLCDDYATHVLGHARRALNDLETENENDAIAIATIDANRSRRINPFVVPRTMPNTIAASLSIKFQLNGPSHTYCQACASGTAAIGNAYRAIQAGHIDMALAGGSEYFSDHLGGLGHELRHCSHIDT
jgi:3-oxoacyl-[acyl-carrier-protein] synthase II